MKGSKKMPLKQVMEERNRIKAIQDFHKYIGCVAVVIGAHRYTVNGVTIWDHTDSGRSKE